MFGFNHLAGAIVEKIMNAMRGDAAISAVLADKPYNYGANISRKMNGPRNDGPVTGPLMQIDPAGNRTPVTVLSRRYRGREFFAPVKYAPYQTRCTSFKK